MSSERTQPHQGRDRSRGFAAAGGVILCADDFAISDGVSRGIEDLAAARRLSATSALVTLPGWPSAAPRLVKLRPYLAIGLHINLTLGPPLGPMPSLAPLGRLPRLSEIIPRALTRRLDQRELAAEISRQIDQFQIATGVAPDFIDGHQHVHTLPVVRSALLEVLEARFPADATRRSLLVRDPADRFLSIWRRGTSATKAQVISLLARGFGAALRRAGFLTNDGFSGVSAFDVAVPYDRELCRFFEEPGSRHLVMCHPGYPDAELARLDPHTERRRQELDELMTADGLVEAIWHIDRRRVAAGVEVPGVNWPALENPAFDTSGIRR